MKKIITLLLALLLVGCSNTAAPEATASAEAQASATTEATPESTYPKSDMSGYVWLEDSDHVFVDISWKEFISFMENKGTGIVYFGYAGCPWCERAVPELDVAAKQAGVTVYYLNAHAEYTEEESNKVFELLTPLQDEDGGLFVPEVMAIKDGAIVGDQLALVDDFEITSEDAQMNDTQKKALQDIYTSLFDLIK